MRIDRVLIRTLRLPLREPFRTATGVTRDRTFLLVQLFGEGVEGIAECVAQETPHYMPETVETARWVLEHHLAPVVVGRRFEEAAELGAAMERAVAGHPMARASIEMAAWDAEARAGGLSLASLLGGERERVPAGVAVGIHGDTDALLDRIAGYLDAGYRRIKLKITPRRDHALLEAVRARFPDTALTVDANGSYSVADMDALSALDAYGLDYIEQPFAADALVEHAVLAERLETPICLDESVTSVGRCRTALALGACGVVNIKPGRVGGHGPAREIHDLCRDAGVPVWCGGMLESGVGRAHNVALASLPHMTLPGDVSASERYWERDTVVPPFVVDSEGMVRVPAGEGIGVEVDEAFVREVEVERVEVG